MKRIPTIAVLSLALLTACEGDVKSTLGLDREAPDEFSVVSRPPLSLPPEFTLRPPRPGEAPLTPSADAKARALITGSSATPAATEAPQGAAQSLLKRAGADAADSNIREKLGVDARTAPDTSNAPTLLDKLNASKKNEPTVDATKETERLRSNKEAGKPINEGEVPEEKPKSDSLIDTIF